MRRASVILALVLLATSSVVAAQAIPWELFRTTDGTLWVIANGVRHRIVPKEVSPWIIEQVPEGDAWESGQIGAASVVAEPVPTGVPVPEQDVVLAAQGFGQDRAYVGYGFVMENRRSDLAYSRISYQVALYDGGGAVLKTDSGTIDYLAPGQRLGVGDDTILPDNTKATRIEVQILSRQPSQDTRGQFLTGQGATYRPDTYYPKVTGTIQNALGQTITTVRVSALAYNNAGAIIGGGYVYVDFIPANGQAAAEVSVHTAGKPARVELHPVQTILSKFQ